MCRTEVICPACGSVIVLAEDSAVDVSSMSEEDVARVARALCSCYLSAMSSADYLGFVACLFSSPAGLHRSLCFNRPARA